MRELTWEGLTPPYRTIAADPPWEQGDFNGWGRRRDLPYSTMTTERLAALPVADLVEREGYLFLWATNKLLERAFIVCRAWGFTPRQTLTWCKPSNGLGLGGMFATTTEFVIVGQAIREGTNAHGSRTNRERVETSWWEWPRGQHSEKPPAFLDIVERVSPGPYLELFARAPRFGWDSWGYGYESGEVPVCAFCGQPGGVDDPLNNKGAHRGCLVDYEYDRVQSYLDAAPVPGDTNP